MSNNNQLQKIEESEIFIRSIVDDVVNQIKVFFDEDKKLFHVSFKNDRNPQRPSFNTASCVIGRILENRKDLAPFYVDKKDWAEIREISRKLKVNYEESEDYSNILPLNSFGILPPFSVSHLARYLLANDLQDKIIFKICLLRILKIIEQTETPEITLNIVADLHPYLLYNYYRILQLFNKKTRNSLYAETRNSLYAVTSPSLTELSDILLGKASKIDDVGLTNLLPKLVNPEELFHSYSDSKTTWNHFIERKLIEIEFLAKSNALTHMEWASNNKISDFDPGSLLYSVLILHSSQPQKYRNLILHGLSILEDKIEPCGIWRPSLPFYVDDKARAIYVTSYQLAHTISSLYASRTSELIDKFENILELFSKFNNWLYEHRLNIKIPELNGNQNQIIWGWCSDDAPDYQRVDTWVTVHTFNYCIQQLRLLENMKKLLVLKKYSFPSIIKNTSRKERPWDEQSFFCNILDSNNEYSKVSLSQIKDIISPTDLNNDSQLSPMFLLYGPPGTSKTTLAEKISIWQGWDLIKLSPSDFVSEGLEQIETKSREIFYNLQRLHKTVIVFDEMDSLIRKRSSMKKIAAGTMVDFVIPAFLPKLQDLRDYSSKHQLAVFLITNFYGDIDDAIKREGRFDNHYLILPLNTSQRYSFVLNYVSARNSSLPTSFNESLFSYLNSNQQTRLFVFRENLRLADVANKLIVNGKINELNECKITARAILPEFYDPKVNENSYNEFNQILKHIISNSELKDGKIVDKLAVDLVLPDWEDIKKKWTKSRGFLNTIKNIKISD